MPERYGRREANSIDRPQMIERLRGWMASGQARDWRKAAGWTAETAAKKLGVGKSTLDRWEANKADPRGHHADDYYRFLTRYRNTATTNT